MKTDFKYTHEEHRTPLTYWVHFRRGPFSQYRKDASPPMPKKVVGKGFPLWTLTHKNQELHFSSLEEIHHVIEVLGQKILPTTLQLTRDHSDLNRHWRSRLNKVWHPWKTRQMIVKKLEALL